MTNEIFLLNPRKRAKRKGRKRAKRKSTNPTLTVNRKTSKRKGLQKGLSTMAKTKKRRKAGKARRNPTNPSTGRARAIVRRARTGITSLNYRQALRNVPLTVLGMFAAKWAAKRGTPNALESDPSTWDGMTYIKGGAGAVGGAIIANMLKPGSGQKVLEGGLALLAYKAAQNHLIPKSTFMVNQFGQDETTAYQPGDVETNSEGEPFILGADGQTWIPLDEGDEEIPMGYGDVLETPGRLGAYGDVLETPGRLGQSTADAYAASLFRR
jgi:hypothetical protein